MRSRALRLSAAIISMLCLTGVPAQAGPVVFNQVMQVLSSNNNLPDLQLRNVSQTEIPLVSDVSSAQSGDQKSSGSKGGKTTESLISGITIETDGPTPVEVIDTGDVEGTICDCGELLLAGGGFPKWPFLFLGAIPLFFINQNDSSPTPTPTPTPPPINSPTPTPVPEPASLMLLASGLAAAGAAIRRRRAKVGVEKEEN